MEKGNEQKMATKPRELASIPPEDLTDEEIKEIEDKLKEGGYDFIPPPPDPRDLEPLADKLESLGYDMNPLTLCDFCGDPRGNVTPCPHCGMD